MTLRNASTLGARVLVCHYAFIKPDKNRTSKDVTYYTVYIFFTDATKNVRVSRSKKTLMQISVVTNDGLRTFGASCDSSNKASGRLWCLLERVG